MTTHEVTDLDRLFGPMDPEAEELAMLLKGYPTREPMVLDILRAASEEDRNVILEFADSCPSPFLVAEYLDGLVCGYHRVDPHRTAHKAKVLAAAEIEKGERYIELFRTMPHFPVLKLQYDEFNGEASELMWETAQDRGVRAWGSNEVNEIMIQIRAALVSPEYADFRYREQEVTV